MPSRRVLSEEEFRAAAKAGPVDDVKLQKDFIPEVRVVGDGGGRTVDFVISTDAVDRYGDTVSVDGWQLANYRKNNVVLWAHDSSMPPIAKGINVRVEDGKLKASAEFVPAEVPIAGPMAECTLQLLRGGFLRAVSVGFIPVKYAFSEEDGRSWGVDFLEQELLEFSVCPIPANPEALSEARSAGIDMSPLRDWAVRLIGDEGLALIESDRLAAIEGLPALLRSIAENIPQAARVSRRHYVRASNIVERAIVGEPPMGADPSARPRLAMASRKIALMRG